MAPYAVARRLPIAPSSPLAQHRLHLAPPVSLYFGSVANTNTRRQIRQYPILDGVAIQVGATTRTSRSRARAHRIRAQTPSRLDL